MLSTINGAAAEYAASLFKGEFEDGEIVTTVGIASSEILKQDPERVFLAVFNLSSNEAYLGFDPNVSASRGIRLASNGGAFSLNARDDLILATRGIHLLGTVPNQDIYILYMRRFAKAVQ